MNTTAALLSLMIFAVLPVRVSELHTPRSQACESAYRRLFTKGTLPISVIFGYKDTRPFRFVGDRYERALFVQEMLDYGFSRSSEDDDLFTKRVKGPKGNYVTVELRVANSSAGPDDDENRRNPYQLWLTQNASRGFSDGLLRGGVVIYNGHSRTGGGPDFAPPRITADRHVDYLYYRQHRPGVLALQSALKSTRSSLVTGLFSCSSDQHFRQAFKGQAFASTREPMYHVEALRASVATVRNLLELRCAGDFQSAGIHLHGFF